MAKGISTEHTAWCCLCPYWTQENIVTIRDMKLYLSKSGWKQTSNGLVCPKCVDKYSKLELLRKIRGTNAKVSN